MMSSLFYAVTIALMVSCSVGKVIDLSHKHGPKTFMSIPGNPGYNLTSLSKGDSHFGVYVELNYYGTSEHSGTHIDAPSHFTRGGMTLDELPIELTIAEGVMIDCSKEAKANHNYAVDVQKLHDFEKTNGEIPKHAAILFYFGWYPKFDDEALYRGTPDVKSTLSYQYPYVSFEAARWLLEKRSLRTIGSDSLSPDPFQINGRASGFPIHILYLPRNITIIENLRDLDKLPPRGFRFHFSPVKYVGASGAQVRAYAITTPEGENKGAGLVHMFTAITLSLTVLFVHTLL
uniref:Kynurenine formamidase n=1 Tax=Arion vulgaris TaxID=1028688 RepID=A0A0B7BJV7_9EUPU